MFNIFKKTPTWFANCPDDRPGLTSHFKMGSDFERPFELVDGFLFFRKEDAAKMAAAKLEEAGWKVTEIHNEEDGQWSVSATHANYMLNEAGVNAMRTLFAGLAKEYDGIYDGWGAPTNK